MEYFIFSPYIKPPYHRHDFTSFVRWGSVVTRDDRNESHEKPFNANDRRKAAQRNAASWWRMGGGERERKKKHFPRACSISIEQTFFPRCHSILIDRGRVVFPFLRWKMRFRWPRSGKARRNKTTREKWGNATPTHWWNVQRIIILIEKFTVYTIAGKFSNPRKYLL